MSKTNPDSEMNLGPSKYRDHLPKIIRSISHSPCFLAFLFLCVSGPVFSQKTYILDLQPKKWEISPKKYFLQSVRDNRADKKNLGKVSFGTAPGKQEVSFHDDLEKDLYGYFSASMPCDTSLIPVTMEIERMHFTETGTVRREVTLHFKTRIVRRLEGKEYELFSIESEPGLIVQGPIPRVCEQLIEPLLRDIMKGFDDWMENNPDQSIFCKNVIPVFDLDSTYNYSESSDSIRWDDNYLLQWPDFRGTVPEETPFSAQSDCQFSISVWPEYDFLTLKMHILLFSCFIRSGSWAKESDKQKDLLDHERIHFAICEWYLRQMKEEIRKTKFNIIDSDKQLRPIFEQKWKEYQLAQDQYDAETQHGIINHTQLIWKVKIEGELQKK